MEINKKAVETAKTLIKDCMGLKKTEALLVVADKNTFALGQAFAEAGRSCGIETTFVEAPVQQKGEPPLAVAAAMASADAEFLITSMSYSHVKARIAATDKGVRVASMPLMTMDILENYLDADYPLIKKASEHLAHMLTNGNKVRAVTEKGTDVTLNISSRSCHADTGDLTEAGALGNLPAGEAYLAPLENCGDGTIVIDGCITYMGLVEDDITLTLKDGRITKIDGNKSAETLRNFLADKDNEAVGIAEFGIGTNPAAKIIGHPIVDEKVWGTIHIAFGTNTSFGGERQSNIHYDCIINDPTVWIDDVKILEKGKHIY